MILEPVETRQRLIDLARAHQPPFRMPKGDRGKLYKAIFSRHFLRPEDYLDAAHEDIEGQIRARWQEFVDRDLPRLVVLIQEAASSVSTSLAADTATNAATPILADEAAADQL